MRAKNYFTQCVVLLLLLVGSHSIFAQGKGAKPLFSSEQIEITIHKATLDTNGKVQFVDKSSNKVLTGAALSSDEIERGFKASEKAVIRVKSPYPFYIYIVNASDWDGVTLVYPFLEGQNKQFPANEAEDFAYEFTQDPQKASTGREEFLLLISKNKIENPTLTSIQKNGNVISLNETQKKEVAKEFATTGSAEIPVNGDSQKKTSKTKTVLIAGCKTVGIFFPFVDAVCKAVGLGAKPVFNADNEIGLLPFEKTDQVAFRLSFAVSK